MKKKLLTLVSALFLSLLLFPPTAAAKLLEKNNKPFLIQGKLPHYTMMVKKLWDNGNFALSEAQKQELLKIRKKTLSKVKQLAPEIMRLEKQIVKATKKGANPKKFEQYVNRLAKLRARATMVHLWCIYKTKKVLTPTQLKMLQKH